MLEQIEFDKSGRWGEIVPMSRRPRYLSIPETPSIVEAGEAPKSDAPPAKKKKVTRRRKKKSDDLPEVEAPRTDGEPLVLEREG